MSSLRLRLYDLRGKDRADRGLLALYLRTPEIHLIDTSMPPKPLATKPEQADIGGLPVVRGFVGRKKEIRDIRQAINQPQMPAVYIYGLGDVGKTAHAAKIIEKVKQDRSVEAVCVIRCDKIEPTYTRISFHRCKVCANVAPVGKYLFKFFHLEFHFPIGHSSDELSLRYVGFNEFKEINTFLLISKSPCDGSFRCRYKKLRRTLGKEKNRKLFKEIVE